MATQLFSIYITMPVVIDPTFFEDLVEYDVMYDCLPIMLFAKRPDNAPPPGIDPVEWFGAKPSKKKREALSRLFTSEEVKQVQTWFDSLPRADLPDAEENISREIEIGAHEAPTLPKVYLYGLWYETGLIKVSEDLEVWGLYQPYLHALIMNPDVDSIECAVRVYNGLTPWHFEN